jgi:PPE-repeat protein
VATNLFGQNTPSIALTETQYAEMWAQDTSAMYSYAGAAASATSLTPFSSPPSSTNSSGQGSQAAAAAQAGATSIGNAQGVVSSVQQTFSAVPTALSGLAAPAQALTPADLVNLVGSLSGIFVDPELGAAGLGVDSTALPYDIVGALTGFHTDDIVSGWAGIESWPGAAPVPPSPFPVITNLGSPVSAGMGEANTISRMSVPTAWAMAAPEIRLSAVALPATSLGAAAEASAGSAGSVFSQMALAGMAGRAMAGTTATGAGTGGRERIGERVGAPTNKPAEPQQPESPAPPKSLPGGPITSIAAELRELASLRDSGILTDEEFTEQKRRLLPQ